MSDVFDQELRDQLAEAQRELALAQAAGDDDGVQAYQGRVRQLLRIAGQHGIALAPAPSPATDEEG